MKRRGRRDWIVRATALVLLALTAFCVYYVSDYYHADAGVAYEQLRVIVAAGSQHKRLPLEALRKIEDGAYEHLVILDIRLEYIAAHDLAVLADMERALSDGVRD